MTRPYAEVIGDPIAHSKSPLIHSFWLAKLGIGAEYRACHVRPGELADYVTRRRKDAAWRGCNVTIPHKITIMDLIEDPGFVRDSIGAMNTLVRQNGDSIIGTNTDAAGFYAPISGMELKGASVGVIGTGGAAHAVLFALAKAGVDHVTILARNPLKAAALLARFGLTGSVQPLYRKLPAVALLVNATQLGMTGEAVLDIDLAPLTDHAVVYDLVYSPLLTPLLAAAQRRGLTCVDGLEMLIAQAAAAFELFFDQSAPRDYDAELRTLLGA